MLAGATFFTQAGIALRIIQLITVNMKKKEAKISYLNINYIYRMCNSCEAFHICNQELKKKSKNESLKDVNPSTNLAMGTLALNNRRETTNVSF